MRSTGVTRPLPFPHPTKQRAWTDAVDRWVRESAWKSPKTVDLQASILAWLNPRFERYTLDQISYDEIDELVEEISRSGLKPSTINRTLSVLRAILNAAVGWRWIAYAPKVPQLRDHAKRVRFISYSEAQRLLIQLPEHLQQIAAFSLETGLRRSNVTGLTWTQLDLGRRVAWIHADQAKSGHAIPVPLSAEAVRILRGQAGQHDDYVFTYRGRPIKQVNTKAWRAALERAGIDDFRWHDLRHTWASWHAQSGTPLHVLQELGGWRSERMVRHYAHLATEHLQGYVDRMATAVRQQSVDAKRAAAAIADDAAAMS